MAEPLLHLLVTTRTPAATAEHYAALLGVPAAVLGPSAVQFEGVRRPAAEAAFQVRLLQSPKGGVRLNRRPTLAAGATAVAGLETSTDGAAVPLITGRRRVPLPSAADAEPMADGAPPPALVAAPFAATGVYTPVQLAAAYGFPDGDGAGVRVGIVQLGGAFSQADLDTYFALGLGRPGGAPNVTVELVAGATQRDTSDTVEVALDIDVIAAVVPAATITIYFAPNSLAGMYAGLQTACAANSIVSLSWGLAESALTRGGYTAYMAALQAMAASYAATCCLFIASGDSGAGAMFPATLPGCVACGGTTIEAFPPAAPLAESAWRFSSGGYSGAYVRPAYQAVAVPGATRRALPDVSADADPNTGYLVYTSTQGGWLSVGGTSAAAPLWAALAARLNQAAGRARGFLNPWLYGLGRAPSSYAAAFRDVVTGSNGYAATTRWDAVTGLGTPRGAGLAASSLSAVAAADAPATVTGSSPASGPRAGGTLVTLTGTNLAGVATVAFGATSVAVDSAAAAEVTVTAPASATTGAVLLTAASAAGVVAAGERTFTYTSPVPSVTAVSPTAVGRASRAVVTLTGANLDLVNLVRVGASATAAVRAGGSATAITFATPSLRAGSYALAVRVGSVWYAAGRTLVLR